MDMLHAPTFWLQLGAIAWINLLVSGDNAVMIALAARALPRRQQRIAVFWGSAAAVALRIVLTAFAAALLELPWLRVTGGALLLWVGVKLLVPDHGQAGVQSSNRLWHAIGTILVADLAMSLDNVLAVAAAANAAAPTPDLAEMKYTLLVLGLALSIPIVVFGSVLMLGIMSRFPAVIWAGAMLLGWIAGEIVVEDAAISHWIGTRDEWLRHSHTASIAGALLVVALGKAILRGRQGPDGA